MELSRRSLLRSSGAVGAMALLPSCATRMVAAAGPSTGAEAVLADAAETYLALYPENATSLGIDTGARSGLKSRLTDRSATGQQAIAARLDATIARLRGIDQSRLDPTTRVHVDTVLTSLESGREGFRFGYGDVAVGSWRNTPYAVIQNVGAYLDVPRFLDSEHQIRSASDADAYLARLESYPAQLDGETERLKAAAARGVIAPDFLIDKALRQLRLARGGNPGEWGVVTSLARRTKDIPGDWSARARAIAAERIAPALDRQIAEMEHHRARATSAPGVWKQPDGDAYYAWALSAATTTRLTPDEVHRVGLDELRGLQAEMDVILRKLGYSNGSVGARMTALGKDQRFLFPDNDEGRAQILALLNQRIGDIRSRMPRAFNTLVPGNVEVRRLPPEEEPGAPGAYGGAGSIDGSVPGKFWINLRTTGLHTRYSLPTLSYHEAIPGHVWQGEYTFKLPLVRTLLGFSAYGEGWALYAEQLAGELGVYDDDPVGRLGYLQSIAFRACRLVVDTGLHAKRWSRDQAVRWFAEANGSSVEEVSGEVDRYCSWPGQACAYKIGHSEINRLRARARAELGPRYDFKAFNDAVVLGGSVPLTVLGRIIDRHIAERKA
jgi:uncharacterized protein (DUF885 family)